MRAIGLLRLVIWIAALPGPGPVLYARLQMRTASALLGSIRYL